jgi:hypothetical protein
MELVWGIILYVACLFALFSISHKRVFNVEEGFRIDQVVPALASDFICSKLKSQIDYSKGVLAGCIETDAVSSAAQMVNALILLNDSFKAHKCDQYA